MVRVSGRMEERDLEKMDTDHLLLQRSSRNMKHVLVGEVWSRESSIL